MENPLFREFSFNMGWKSTAEIELFGKNVTVTIKMAAYYEEDGITPEQKKSYEDWANKMNEKLELTEKLLIDYSSGNAEEQFVAKTLLFNRNGDYALLFDDTRDNDGGIAVCIAPEEKVVSQDEYL